ncbi:MAG: Outer membrane protein assembly factor BamB [bacterium]|nr:Outer membrane protein assembly factor BamB [bacterium]
MRIVLAGIVWLCAWSATRAVAEDWPTHRHDFARSGITAETLRLPLQASWVHVAKLPPQPAWPGPARSDGWHKVENLKPRVIFDWAYHLVAAGGAVFYGSSANDKVYALDSATGKERWSFFTEGPVRLAPTYSQGKLFVGADDGRVYCLEAADGNLIWEFDAAPSRTRLPGNNRLMSLWPVRSGVVVQGQNAYFTAGLFPFEGASLCAVQVADGKELWRHPVTGMAPQGYLLASSERLFMPTGRGTPYVFDKKSGEFLYTIEGSGGTFCLLTGDQLIYGPGKTGELDAFQPGDRDEVATFQGNQMIVTGDKSFLHTDTELRAIDRTRYMEISLRRAEALRRAEDFKKESRTQERDGNTEAAEKSRARQRELEAKANELAAELPKCVLWSKECAHPYSLILAGETLFAGGTDSVGGFSTETGEQVWRADVVGRALDLAVADGRLYVSTDKGRIHAFATN